MRVLWQTRARSSSAWLFGRRSLHIPPAKNSANVYAIMRNPAALRTAVPASAVEALTVTKFSKSSYHPTVIWGACFPSNELHGATLQVQRPAHLQGCSIHFTSAKSKKPRFLKASTIPVNDPAMMVMALISRAYLR